MLDNDLDTNISTFRSINILKLDYNGNILGGSLYDFYHNKVLKLHSFRELENEVEFRYKFGNVNSKTEMLSLVRNYAKTKRLACYDQSGNAAIQKKFNFDPQTVYGLFSLNFFSFYKRIME